MDANHSYQANITVHLLLVERGKILLMQQLPDGFQIGSFGIPSGHMELTDFIPTATAIRIAEGVTGIYIEPRDLLMMHTSYRMDHTGDGHIDLFFKAGKWFDKPIVMDPGKYERIVWADPHDIPKRTGSYIREIIKRVLVRHEYDEDYTEFGPDSFITNS